MPQITAALGPDAAGLLLHDFILQSNSTLDVAIWEMGMSFGHLLLEPGLHHVRKRLLLDGHGEANTTTALRLGDEVELRVFTAAASEAHWKILLRDGCDVALGTGNLTSLEAPQLTALPSQVNAATGTREWWVFLHDAPSIAAQFLAALDDTWSQCDGEAKFTPRTALTAPLVHPLSPLVAPISESLAEDCLQAVSSGLAISQTLMATMVKARERLWVTQPYIHGGVPRVAETLGILRSAHRRGVDCRLLLGQPSSESYDLRPEIPIREMDAAMYTAGHAKGVIIDDTVIVSSANWSEAGLGTNREAGLVIADAGITAYYAAAFNRDWEASRV